jgi:hypothetical protein
VVDWFSRRALTQTHWASDEPSISRDHVSLLSWSYELKNIADCAGNHEVSQTDARRAIDEAERLVAVIVALESIQPCGVHYAANAIASSSFAGRKLG